MSIAKRLAVFASRNKKRSFLREGGYGSRMLCGWSPLREATTFEGAQKAAGQRVDARSDAGNEKRDSYWA